MAHSHNVNNAVGLVPVTILTGFLGAGKTTLLNHILSATHGKKIAVIENEFGDVGIDDALLQTNMKSRSDEEIVEMLNGCICCNVRTDLIAVLKKLAVRAKGGLKLDGIIIETTGMANPAPVAQTFFVEEDVKAFCKLDGIVTLVDAKHIEQHLNDQRGEGAENEAVEQVAFADRLLLNKIDVVPGEADLKRIEDRLRSINKFAPIVRTQGSNISVDSVLNIGAFDLKRAQKVNPWFLSTDNDYVHDFGGVTSVGINVKENLDLGAIQTWMGNLLKDKGADLYRMKGVLAIAHADQRFVYQAVHMLFDGNFMESWGKDEDRCSKLTFIGKNLNEEELRKGFMACLATPERNALREKSLRYKIGDRVSCNSGPEWCKGKVVALMYRDPHMPPGLVAPYQIKLDSGDLIYAPADEDCVIQKI